MRLGFVLYAGLDPGSQDAAGARGVPPRDRALYQATGGTIYDRYLVEGLRALGDSVELWPLERGPLAAVQAAWRARRAHSVVDGPEVVLEDELVHPSLFWRPRTGRGPRRVALVHNLFSRQPDLPLAPWARERERRYLLGIDGAIAVCQSTLDDLLDLRASRGRAPAPLPTRVVYAGRDHLDPAVDDELVVRRALEPGPLRALFVGAVAPHKGLRRLVTALQPADAAWLRLEVAGSLTADWRYAVGVKAEIASRGLQELVFLRGPLDATALGALYRQSQVLVLPSDRESYPLSGIEALGHGLVPLLTDAGGTGELVRDGESGHLLSPEQPGRWRERLWQLHQQRAELAAQAKKARARYLEHGTWLDAARAVQAFCQQLRPFGSERHQSP